MQAKPGPGLLVVVHRLAPIWFEGDDLFGRILPKSELFHIKLANFLCQLPAFVPVSFLVLFQIFLFFPCLLLLSLVEVVFYRG